MRIDFQHWNFRELNGDPKCSKCYLELAYFDSQNPRDNPSREPSRLCGRNPAFTISTGPRVRIQQQTDSNCPGGLFKLKLSRVPKSGAMPSGIYNVFNQWNTASNRNLVKSQPATQNLIPKVQYPRYNSRETRTRPSKPTAEVFHQIPRDDQTPKRDFKSYLQVLYIIPVGIVLFCVIKNRKLLKRKSANVQT